MKWVCHITWHALYLLALCLTTFQHKHPRTQNTDYKNSYAELPEWRTDWDVWLTLTNESCVCYFQLFELSLRICMCVPKARELHSQLLLIQLNSSLSQIPVTVASSSFILPRISNIKIVFHRPDQSTICCVHPRWGGVTHSHSFTVLV